jgi:hypothetical protein
MKFRRNFPPLAGISVLTVLLITITLGSTQPVSAVAPDHGISARGTGDFFNFLTREGFHFEFDVQSNKNGNAHGRAEFDNLTAGTQVIIKVRCLNGDASSAAITGTVLRSDDPDFPKHTSVVFAAIDGQSFGGIDRITPLFPGPDPKDDCLNAPFPLTLFELPGGSIEIEP